MPLAPCVTIHVQTESTPDLGRTFFSPPRGLRSVWRTLRQNASAVKIQHAPVMIFRSTFKSCRRQRLGARAINPSVTAVAAATVAAVAAVATAVLLIILLVLLLLLLLLATLRRPLPNPHMSRRRQSVTRIVQQSTFTIQPGDGIRMSPDHHSMHSQVLNLV